MQWLIALLLGALSGWSTQSSQGRGQAWAKTDHRRAEEGWGHACHAMETPSHPPERLGFFLRWAPCESTESGLPPAPVTVHCFPLRPLRHALEARCKQAPGGLPPLKKGGPSVDTARCHVRATPPNASFPAAKDSQF